MLEERNFLPGCVYCVWCPRLWDVCVCVRVCERVCACAELTFGGRERRHHHDDDAERCGCRGADSRHLSGRCSIRVLTALRSNSNAHAWGLSPCVVVRVEREPRVWNEKPVEKLECTHKLVQNSRLVNTNSHERVHHRFCSTDNKFVFFYEGSQNDNT